MAKYTVVEDMAILDLGKEEDNRFFVLENPNIDETGSPDKDTLKRAKEMMLTQCGNADRFNDSMRYFNEGDIIYTSYASGRAIEKFMIETEVLKLTLD